MARILAQNADTLADGFRQPPPEARPHTWWHWMNGNVSKEGITADLEAMARIGVGGAQIFNVARDEPAGPVRLLTPEWFALTKHAMAEAKRLGLDLGMHACPGWSESGGPWVKPEQAMQQVTWSEIRVTGPQTLSVPLPQPFTVQNFYRDITVLALPAGPDDEQDFVLLAPKVTTSAPGVDASALATAGNTRDVALPTPTAEQPQWLQFEFATPQHFASLRVEWPEQRERIAAATVEVSDDGVAWRKVSGQSPWLNNRNVRWQQVTFAGARARFFRLVITQVVAVAKSLTPPVTVSFSTMQFGGPRLRGVEELAGYKPNPSLKVRSDAGDGGVAAGRVIDLTSRVRNGRLEWDVPAGHWSILRFGHTLTGQINGPAAPEGRGLECDKLSREAVEAHFAGMMGRVLAEAGPLAGQSLKVLLVDSWEAGCQNWTPAFREEFQRRRGYDLTPYLPALAGRIIGSEQESERFLWDFRGTIGELIAENHYGTFQELSRQHGLSFMAEAPGINMPTIADELACKGRTDVPMGEFWLGPGSDYWPNGANDTKETAAAAHIYGKRLVAAEAFTAAAGQAKWSKSPFDHKMIGDLNFTFGINQYVFHRYTHQPWLDRTPGMTMGPYGTNFERTNTWWEPARAWMEYIARCQYLLRQGLFIADVCYFYGENTPNMLSRYGAPVPAGYDYDACNAEVLLTRLRVQHGRLVLPDGMSYRLLLLPESTTMTPEVLRKIRDLIVAGATVVGPRPSFSPSLVDFPGCDAEVARLAAEIWGDCDGVKATEHALGEGRVVWGRPLAEVLASLGAPPDFAANRTDGKFAFIHRKADEADIYFVSSQNKAATTATLTFRAGGRVPEIWHPDTGRIERTASFTEIDGLVSLPLDFDPAGSVFVVFRAPSRGLDAVAGVSRDGAETMPGSGLTLGADGGVWLTATEPGVYEFKTVAGQTRRATVTPLPPAIDLAGPWTIRFPAGWGAPSELQLAQLDSWTRQADDGVKYFSGTATYFKAFELPPGALAPGRELRLDLGRVKEIAEVTLNGRALGILWKPPFQVDITAAAREGENRLEIRITNLWPNRLIGDQRLPEKERHTWASYNPFNADSPLLESGLLGPVHVTVAARTEIK